jgi:hypothetical protein
LGNYNVQTNTGGALLDTTNTSKTWPAALMGDALTILSSSWSDTYTNTTSLGSRGTAGNSTVNAACLEGIVPSVTVGGVEHYSGGLENFLRLEEDWSKQLTYNGSIVVMFPSVYATNYWHVTGVFYNPPTRKWGFDSNFKTPEGSPPGVPSAKGVIRGGWMPLAH